VSIEVNYNQYSINIDNNAQTKFVPVILSNSIEYLTMRSIILVTILCTISHSPPVCESYHQLNKEQAMYDIIQKSISAGLIRQPHSACATPAILV
ncbi:unnamed protein product, partial [Rotaria socialis]